MGEELSERRGAGTGAVIQAQGLPLTLHIQSLGVPEVRLEGVSGGPGGVPLRFPTKKTLALLLYLAVTGNPQPREQLAALFWPDRADERARATLRSTLRLLRQALADASDDAIPSQPEDAGKPSDPARSSKQHAVTKPTDLFLRSGHDRLGRDCLWLEMSASTASTSPARYPSASAHAAETVGRAGEKSGEGNQGSDGAAVRLDLDLHVLEQAATLAARLSAHRPSAPSAHAAALGDGELGAVGDELSQHLQRLASAVATFRGAFLAGFTLEDSDTFSAWVEQQRAYWQGRMDRVFEALSRLQLEHGAFAAARETAARWVELNALEEAAYRRLMEALAAAGDRTAALTAYARGRETLARTLGVEPDPETVALAERIRRQTSPSERPPAEGSGAGSRPRGDPLATATVAASAGHPPVTARAPHVPHMHPLGDPALLALPLAGREAEFAALVAACERARQGQGSATIVVLEGAGGIGKTRLAGEFLRWAAQTRGAEVLRGQAFEAGGRLPYQPLVEALRRRLDRERAPDDLLDDVWLAELSRLLPELRERYPDLAMPAPSAGGDDGVAAERLFEAVAQLGLALARQQREAREGTPGSGAPLVLFLDDVQWTDVGTRDLVRFVVARWREVGVPALVLLTLRREDLSTHGELRDWLRDLAREVGETGMSTVALRPLDAGTLHRLLEALAIEDLADSVGVNVRGRGGGAQTGDGGDGGPSGVAPPTMSTSETDPRAGSQTIAQLAQWLYAETGGQPLYLVQMLRALLEQGVLAWEERAAVQPADSRTGSRASAHWQLRVNVSAQEVANLGRVLPASMRAVIQQRLDRLSAPTRQLLMAGAVLGTRFRPEQAWAVAGLDEASGLEALEEAERQIVVQVESDRGGETCQFTHDKLREVLYTETGAVRRRILHRRAYELLAAAGAGERARPAELADHALLAGLREPAYHHSVAAGDAALAVYAVRDAIRYYEQARQLLTERGSGESREFGQLAAGAQGQLFNQLGRAYEWVGAWEEAKSAYQALHLHARERGDRALEATALLRLAMTAWHAFDMATAQDWARGALAVVETTRDVALRAEAEWTFGQVETIAGEVDVALPHAQRAVELARAAELPDLVARSQVRLAMTHILSGAWDEAVVVTSEAQKSYAALVERALEEDAKARSGSTTAITTTTTTPASRTQATAAGWAFGGSLPATTAAHQSMEATALSLRAFGEICRGDPQAGVETGRTAHRMARDCGSAYAQLYSGFILAVGLDEVGAYEEGLLAARQGLDAARANGDPRLTLHALASLAYALQALHRIEDAWPVLEEALALAERVGIRMWWTGRPLAYWCANRALAEDWAGAAAAALRAMALRDALSARLMYFDFTRHHETEAFLRAGEAERARADVERLAGRLRPQNQDRRYQLVLLRMRAVLARFEGQLGEAADHLEAGLRLAEEIGLPGEEWQLLAELARLRGASGDATGATAAQAQAESIVAALAARIVDPQLRATYVRATTDALRV